jgi:hypothetical protein
MIDIPRGSGLIWHRDEGQNLWLQSLWLPNQEWLARSWQAKYIGPCGSVADPHRKNADVDADPVKKSQCGCGFIPLLNYGEPSSSIRNL